MLIRFAFAQVAEISTTIISRATRRDVPKLVRLIEIILVLIKVDNRVVEKWFSLEYWEWWGKSVKHFQEKFLKECSKNPELSLSLWKFTKIILTIKFS